MLNLKFIKFKAQSISIVEIDIYRIAMGICHITILLMLF